LYGVVLGLYCFLLLGLGFCPDLRKPFVETLPCYLLYAQEIALDFPWMIWGPQHLPEWSFAHSWTLGVEEKFYLFWPLLAFVLWRGNPSQRLACTAALSALFALLSLLLAPLGSVGQAGGKMLFCYSSLLSGCLLALLLHDPEWFSRLLRHGSSARANLTLLVLLTAHFLSPWVARPWSGVLNVVYTLSAVVLLGYILQGYGCLPRLLRFGPLVLVGRLSYGIYLIHMLCMFAAYKVVPASSLGLLGSVLAYLVTCLLSLLAASVLQKTIEKPCVDQGKRWARQIIETKKRCATRTVVVMEDLALSQTPEATVSAGPLPRASAATTIRQE
jgi:peptidoglycan/LPS O-acetylase OafA/YrhL